MNGSPSWNYTQASFPNTLIMKEYKSKGGKKSQRSPGGLRLIISRYFRVRPSYGLGRSALSKTLDELINRIADPDQDDSVIQEIKSYNQEFLKEELKRLESCQFEELKIRKPDN